MNCLQNEDGTLIYEPEEIKHHVADYHENLFNNDPTLFHNPIHTRIIEQNIVEHVTDHTHDQDDPLNEDFTLEELNNVIKSLPKGKSSGPNAICYELE